MISLTGVLFVLLIAAAFGLYVLAACRVRIVRTLADAAVWCLWSAATGCVLGAMLTAWSA